MKPLHRNNAISALVTEMLRAPTSEVYVSHDRYLLDTATALAARCETTAADLLAAAAIRAVRQIEANHSEIQTHLDQAYILAPTLHRCASCGGPGLDAGMQWVEDIHSGWMHPECIEREAECCTNGCLKCVGETR